MSNADFKEFMHDQTQTIKKYCNRHKNTDKNELALQWVAKNAKKYRVKWSAKHHLINF